MRGDGQSAGNAQSDIRELGPASGKRQKAKGQLTGAGAKPVSAEQMELTRLRAELVRVKMESDILKKATAYFARESA